MKKNVSKAKDTSTLPLLITILSIFLFAVLTFVIVVITDTRNKPAKTASPKPTATVKPTPYPVTRAAGALERSFLFGGDGTDNFGSIIKLSNGGFAVSGFTHKSAGTGFFTDIDARSANSMHANVICFDASGKKVWLKDLCGNAGSDPDAVSDESSLGGSIFFDMAESGDSIIAVGASNELGTGDFASLTARGMKDSVICAFDKATGEIKWIKAYGSVKHDMFNKIIADGASLIVSGSYEENTSLYKLDGNGNEVWRVRLSDANLEVEDILSLEDKYIVIASNYMFSVSMDGQLIKKKRFPVLYRGLVKTDNGFAAVGSTESSVNLADFVSLLPKGTTDTSVYRDHGSMDGFIALYNNDAEIVDFRFWGGEGADGFFDAVLSPDGNAVIAVGYAGFSSFGNGTLTGSQPASVKTNGVVVMFEGLTPKHTRVFANTETSETYLYRVANFGSGYACVGTDKSTDAPSENEVFERVKGTDAIVLFFDDASSGFN